MNKLDTLIAQLCPHGVEYHELGSIWQKAVKSKLGVAKIKNLDAGETICFTSGKQNYFVNQYLVDGEYIFMNDGGTADTKFYNGKAYYTDHVFCFSVDRITTDSKFIYYILKENETYINDVLFKGTGLKNLNKRELEKLRIPVPPLPIQQEIVKTLDKFTMLEAELEAELEARKLQYEHYRNALLSFEDEADKGGVHWVALGEVAMVNAGGDVPQNFIKGQKSPDDKFPYPIYSNGSEENALYGYTNEYRVNKEAVTISARGTIGWHTVRKPKFTPIVRLITLIPDCRILSTKYLNYVLDITEIGHSGGSIPQLTVPNVKKIKIPIPPLPEQKRIVAILDKFDALTTDISIGLPAEIKARRQQYEYYRNLLLTFDELEAA